MQQSISGAQAPAPVPQPPAGTPPGPVEAPEYPRRNRWLTWVLLGLVILGGAGVAYWMRQSAQASQQATHAAPTRTTTVGTGRVQQSVRLTGTTAAERYVSLITPQMRGSRSGRGQSYSGGGQASASLNITSNAPPSGYSSGSSSSSGTPTSNAAQGGISGGGASNASAALKSATSRVSSSSTSSSARAAANSATNTQETGAAGADGLGSTGSQLGAGGGGGGGGGGDFMMSLQSVAKPGSHIRKGDTIAEFDRQYMLNRLDDYRSSVHQAEASFKQQNSIVGVTRRNHQQLVDSAKADLDKAELDMKTVPVLSSMDAERAKLSRAEAEARYKQLLTEVPFVRTSEEASIKISEMDLQSTKLELRRAEANADRMIVKAPIDGLVVMQTIIRGGELGQIQAGDQLYPGQMFMQIVDPASMVVNATINQVDVEKVRIGSKATVRFDAYPELSVPAHVYSIAAITKPGGMRASFVKEVAVSLKLDGMDSRIIPDLSVSAEIHLDSEPQETAVAPLGAIFRDQPAAPAYVWVQQGEGWIRREVELGLANHVQVAVRKGLKAGEVIALEPPKRQAAAESAAKQG